jgi:hypothetical protein
MKNCTVWSRIMDSSNSQHVQVEQLAKRHET